MELLRAAGKLVIPITGRPAGWCDHIARMWPVDAVVGENGALYMRYDAAAHKLERRFVADEATRRDHRDRLAAIADKIVAAVPGSAARIRPALPRNGCRDRLLRGRASTHSGGDRSGRRHDGSRGDDGQGELHPRQRLVRHLRQALDDEAVAEGGFGIDIDADRERVRVRGDSPNDAPMFAFFPNAVGVANVRAFTDRIATLPAYVTRAESGAGFAELARFLLA